MLYATPEPLLLITCSDEVLSEENPLPEVAIDTCPVTVTPPIV
jgi:hypothetical protein